MPDDKKQEQIAGGHSNGCRDGAFEEALRYWQEITAPLTEATRKAERLTEKDFAIRINARN